MKPSSVCVPPNTQLALFVVQFKMPEGSVHSTQAMHQSNSPNKRHSLDTILAPKQAFHYFLEAPCAALTKSRSESAGGLF